MCGRQVRPAAAAVGSPRTPAAPPPLAGSPLWRNSVSAGCGHPPTPRLCQLPALPLVRRCRLSVLLSWPRHTAVLLKGFSPVWCRTSHQRAPSPEAALQNGHTCGFSSRCVLEMHLLGILRRPPHQGRPALGSASPLRGPSRPGRGGREPGTRVGSGSRQPRAGGQDPPWSCSAAALRTGIGPLHLSGRAGGHGRGDGLVELPRSPQRKRRSARGPPGAS